jgi:prevent-host-death family protein
VTTTVDIRELPERLDELLAEAGAGGEVIVTERGMPRARLLPLAVAGPRTPSLHPGAFQVAADFDEPLPDEFWTGQP